MESVNKNEVNLDNIGVRLRSERRRLDLSQEAFAAIGGASKPSQVRYENGERSPDGNYLSKIADAGVDVLYVLTGIRAATNINHGSPITPIDPVRLMICAKMVTDEYTRAGIDLQEVAHWNEAIWAYNELVSRLEDPADGDELEATLPLVRHLLRKRFLAEKPAGAQRKNPTSC